MIILLLFAFLAGLATIVSPCILPILPIVLSAGVSGGKQRPLGIVVGLIVSFTAFTLAISEITKLLGISSQTLRDLAIIILLIFGILILVPRFMAAFEKWVGRFTPRKLSEKQGSFLGGILLGLSLGIVWTPCVGPIMASVIVLAATSTVTLGTILITLAYIIGTAIPLFFLILGGKKIMQRLKKSGNKGEIVQRVFGAIMVLTAVGMLFNLDLTLEARLLASLPSGISAGLTQGLENSQAVQGQLAALSGKSTPVPVSGSDTGSGLPILSNAPEFTGITNWLNSAPLTMAGLKGKVVLVDFWTYSCINCLRSLPHVIGWYNTYKDQGLVVVGVSAPEFDFEKDPQNVVQAIKANAIPYPIAQDNNLATWTAYSNEYWPAEYLIDAQGRVRATDFGEGNYDKMESNIRALLKEANMSMVIPSAAPVVPDLTPQFATSPETYLGTDRRSGDEPGIAAASLALNSWTTTGTWQDAANGIISQNAGDTLSYHFYGQNMYLVMNPPAGHSVKVQVVIDGKAITAAQAGADVRDGIMTVDTDRLYSLVHLPATDSGHVVTLIFESSGVKAFSYTFG